MDRKTCNNNKSCIFRNDGFNKETLIMYLKDKNLDKTIKDIDNYITRMEVYFCTFHCQDYNNNIYEILKSLTNKYIEEKNLEILKKTKEEIEEIAKNSLYDFTKPDKDKEAEIFKKGIITTLNNTFGIDVSNHISITISQPEPGYINYKLTSIDDVGERLIFVINNANRVK